VRVRVRDRARARARARVRVRVGGRGDGDLDELLLVLERVLEDVGDLLQVLGRHGARPVVPLGHAHRVDAAGVG